MNYNVLPKQPSMLYSYLNVGKLLYYSLIIFIFETVVYWVQFDKAFRSENWLLAIFWFGSVLFAFTHIFLVMMDGWSRFQNYKRIKDHIYQHGFTVQIASHYKGSKCQRRAVIVAAAELGHEKEAYDYFATLNLKWYNIVPHFMLKDPLFLFKRYFWSRTFLEKYYTAKYNYRELEQQQQISKISL
jgi:hypothetical protein